MIDWYDAHRKPLRVGDRVRVALFGRGSSIHDCDKIGTVVGFARTRVRIEIPQRTVGPDVVNIAPTSLVRLGD